MSSVGRSCCRSGPQPAGDRGRRAVFRCVGLASISLFYLFAAVAVLASLLVISQRNPIYSVLLLIASFGALSGLYVLLEAPFVAVTQIIVYAGAIMVLFLFVVMLLNAPHEETERATSVCTRSGARARFASVSCWPLRSAIELTWP